MKIPRNLELKWTKVGRTKPTASEKREIARRAKKNRDRVYAPTHAPSSRAQELLAIGKKKRFKSHGLTRPYLNETEVKRVTEKVLKYEIAMKSEAYIVDEVNRVERRRRRNRK